MTANQLINILKSMKINGKDFKLTRKSLLLIFSTYSKSKKNRHIPSIITIEE